MLTELRSLTFYLQTIDRITSYYNNIDILLLLKQSAWQGYMGASSSSRVQQNDFAAPDFGSIFSAEYFFSSAFLENFRIFVPHPPSQNFVLPLKNRILLNVTLCLQTYSNFKMYGFQIYYSQKTIACITRFRRRVICKLEKVRKRKSLCK